MSITISGTLIGPVGNIRANTTIMLVAVDTSVSVIVRAYSETVTDAAGKYQLAVEPGEYSVITIEQGGPPESVGKIRVLSDSVPGNLNDFLNPTYEDDLTPAVVRAVEQYRAESAASASIASVAADVAVLNSDIYDTTEAGLAAVGDGRFFSVPSQSDSEYIILYKNNSGKAEEIKVYPSVDRIDSLTNGVFNVDIEKYATKTGYIDKNGIIRVDTNWLYSDYIPCVADTKFSFSVIGHTGVCAISFYNERKIFISGVVGSKNNAQFTGNIVAPDCAYMRCSFGNEDSALFPSGSKNSIRMPIDLVANFFSDAESVTGAGSGTIFTSRRKLKLSANSKFMLYGDSISSTDYPWYKSEIQNITGADVYNGGFSGSKASKLASSECLQRIFTYDGEVIVALIGANDTGEQGTIGTFSGEIDGEPVVNEVGIDSEYNGTYFIQAISYIMRAIRAHYYNIRARAELTGDETEEEKTEKIDAVVKPALFFCTPLPQKRNNENDPFSVTANTMRKRAAIIECCNRYSVSCIDLYTSAAFDMSVEPYWVAPTDKTTNSGVYFMDGLHPNKYGYQIIAQIVCAEIGI